MSNMDQASRAFVMYFMHSVGKRGTFPLEPVEAEVEALELLVDGQHLAEMDSPLKWQANGLHPSLPFSHANMCGW